MKKLSFFLLALWLGGAWPGLARGAGFTTSHFQFTYDQARLSRAAAESAAQAAERAYASDQERFATSGPPEIRCNLTPQFLGATGYAQPDRRPPVVAVRIPDLDYLGLDESYVLRHEVAHVFSGRLAGGPMGEGLADFVAGGFSDLPLAQWWGPALRQAGLWVDPDALFITGEYPSAAELDARQRTANYTEPALLLQYLSERFGFARVLAFLPEFGRARRTLDSNAAAARRRGFRRPDPAAARDAFQHQFGRSWTELRGDWERQMAATQGTESARRRLVIGQESYAAIRNYEMWLLTQRGRVQPQRAAAVREAFTQVNAALRAQRFDEAETLLREAEGMVSELKRPMLVARASFSLVPAPERG